jgi:hypothetical protein
MPLSASSDASKWIDDFVHSDDSRFKGKSRKERIRMALGAYYAAKRGSKESLVLDTMALLELASIGDSPYSKGTDPATALSGGGGLDSGTGGLANFGTTGSVGIGMSSTEPTASLPVPPPGLGQTSTSSSLTTPASDLVTPDKGVNLSNFLSKSASSSSLTKIGDSFSEEDNKVVTCPRCGKTGTDPYMRQNHFSHCKYQRVKIKPSASGPLSGNVVSH